MSDRALFTTIVSALLLFLSAPNAGAISAEVTMTLSGTGPGDNFSYGVSSGYLDFNGDGYKDLIVGARTNDDAGRDAGSAYLYFGPALDTVPDLVFLGEGAGDQFGRSVASVGDFNGDGYEDLAIGALLNQAGGFQAGRAYLYWGGPTADNEADQVLTGTTTTQFGQPVFGVGDFSGDGYDDLFVGAGGYRGRGYIFFGGPGADSVPDLTLSGEGPNDEFGWHAAPAGDMNGDGYPDLIVGAMYNAPAGRAYVFLGGPDADATPDLTFGGETPGQGLGFSVCGLGDVNGDGYDDVMAAGYEYSGTLRLAGRAYVFFGGATLDGVPDIVMTGEHAWDRLGEWVSEAGDLDGDGYADMMVCVPGTGGTWEGQVNIYRGGPDADGVADLVLTQPTAPGPFGYGMARGADIDMDGLLEILVSAPNDAGTGRAYIFDVFSGPGETPRGSEVIVRPLDRTSRTPVTVTFSSVTRAGLSRLTSSAAGPPPPSGFRLGQPPIYFDIQTTAIYTGPLEVCIDYSGIAFGNENRLELFHQDGTGAWVKVTTLRDTDNDTICGRVNSLSVFAIFEETPYGTIAGRVLADCPQAGSGVAGVTVSAINSDNLVTQQVTTGSDGSYLMAEVPTGEYTVEMTVPAGYTAETTSVTATVAGGETSSVDLSLACIFVDIAGTVISDCRGPLPGITVDLAVSETDFRTAVTNSNGSYAFQHVRYNSMPGEISLVLPLGLRAVSPPEGHVDVLLTENRTIDFSLTCLQPMEPVSVDAPPRPVALLVHPNPGRGLRTIMFRLPAAEQATLNIVDVSGRLVATVLEGAVVDGLNEVAWDDAGVTPGMYFATLKWSGGKQTVKFVVLAR